MKLGESYAVVNVLGQEVIEPGFSYIGSFEGGLALAQRDGMKFYINSEGIEYRG